MQQKLLLLLCVFSIATASAQTVQRALFIGNSYTATNNLPQMVADCAESVGDSLYYETNSPGGYTFELHTTNATTTGLIAEGIWDYVVLQEQSQIPSFPIDQVEVECFPFATELDNLIRAANSCTETMFFMTWGRKDGDATNCAFWPPVCTYDGMDSLLHERYMMMGDDNDAEVAPVGAVWHYLRDTHPEIELYIGDGSHPSGAGSYAAACTFYTAIFRKDPTEITYGYTIPADQAEIIREAAKLIVFDALSDWYIGTYDFAPTASFTTNTDIPFTAAFNNASDGAENYFWDFGDGSTSAEVNPTHVYAAGGTYTVQLTASICDTSDITTKLIEIIEEEPSGIANKNYSLSLYPNPATETIHIKSVETIHAIIITDMQGKIVLTDDILSVEEKSINIASLPAGMYQLIATTAKGNSATIFVKE